VTGWEVPIESRSRHAAETVSIINRCGYQSITQQYLKKRCLIKDDSNYMFRPNVAVIRFSSESMVVVLYMIGMGMSRW